MPYFDTTDGTRLFYAEAGAAEAPPVVFVHAWAFNSGMWNYQIPAFLAAGMRCVAFDRRGRGRSDVPGQGYDLDRLADDLADLLAYLDLRGAVLVGHSMGAAETVRYLVRHGTQRPGRVKGIVLSAPTTPFLLRTDDNPEGPVQAAAAEAVRTLMRRDIGAFVAATSSTEWFGPGYQVSAGLSDWTSRQFFDTPLQILLSTNKTCVNADLREDLTKVTVPALVIQGDADRSAPLDHTGRRTHALLPHSTFVVIEGAGHGLHMSDPDRYNKELLTFMNDLPE
ncbi:hypothetical protein ADL22_16975 [Streptomyces sp. NRRL F-4489]|uniref:alpha/beta fold hydrolase n=1 Tax=Streptomyces sp. NRRL F-4489 TaxID=1609095 RepID=UPI00074B1DED|nr:alpha/beta hydrolase [Streptomyces sp. NRRL F-4489]KUL38932.1 hypothetical protein ADL22_16975 [Streptomyces sp. NRRL F-4489]